MFNIIEKFLSIDGEGPNSGLLSTFIRFQGCNLRCSWCDTAYSWNEDGITEVLSSEELYAYIKANNTINVTLTGGEPLIQKGINEFLEILNADKNLKVNIETNGAVDIKPFKERFKNINFILDYKLPSSKMTEKMLLSNIDIVDYNDVYKFVIGSKIDLDKAYEIIKTYDLTSICQVFFSPVLGSIDMEEIIDFMKNNNLNKVRFQVQLHKIIWDKDSRGV